VVIGCAVIYAVILAFPQLRGFADLHVPSLPSFGLIGVATLIWLFLLRWIWRSNALERFLDIDFGASHVARAPAKGQA
jgi:hypothetical protein